MKKTLRLIALTLTMLLALSPALAACNKTEKKTDSVAAAVAAVNGAVYGPAPQSAANTKDQARDFVKGVIKGLDLDGAEYAVNDGAFAAAVAGDAASESALAGVNGSYKFTVTLTKGTAGETTTEKTLVITAAAATAVAPEITTAAALSDGVQGTYGSWAIALADGATAPIAWSIATGSLPAGININAATGVISGTPSASGTFTFTVKAQNAGGDAAKAFTLKIKGAQTAPAFTLDYTGTSITVATVNGAAAPDDGSVLYALYDGVGGIAAGFDGSPSFTGLTGVSYVVWVKLAATPELAESPAASQAIDLSLAPQPDFEINSVSSVTYAAGLTVPFATSGGLSTGAVSWSIVNGGGLGNINPGTGVLTVTGAGKITVQAVIAADDDYNSASDTFELTVNPKTLAPSDIENITASSKPYDGNTAATVSANVKASSLVGSDAVTLTFTAAFSDKNVGAGKTVTVSAWSIGGANAANYTASGAVSALTAAITAKALTLSGFTVDTRQYNGNTSITINSFGTLQGIVSPDAVTLNTASATANAEDANVGTKAVTVAGITLSGAGAGNYTLTQPAGITVVISKAANSITWNVGSLTALTYGQKFSQLTSADATFGAVTYQYKGNGIAVWSALTASTNLNAGDYDVRAQVADNANYNAATSAEKTLKVNKAMPGILSGALAVEAKTAESITVKALTTDNGVQGVQFAIRVKGAGGEFDWQTNRVFDDLDMYTEYEIYARAADMGVDGNYMTGSETAPLYTKTLKDAVNSLDFSDPDDAFYFAKGHGVQSVGIESGRLRIDINSPGGEVHLPFNFGNLNTAGKVFNFDFEPVSKGSTQYLAQFRVYGGTSGDDVEIARRADNTPTGVSYNWGMDLSANYTYLRFYFWGTTDGGAFDINNCIVYIDNVLITDKVTVSFDTEGKDTTPPAKTGLLVSRPYGTLPDLVDNSGLDLYTFVGWRTAASGGGTPVTASTIVTNASNHTLYAHWTQDGIQATFDYDGGTGTPAAKKVVNGSQYGALPAPTKTGYRFAGWYTAANGGGTKVTETTLVTETTAHSLYAKWLSAYIYDFSDAEDEKSFAKAGGIDTVGIENERLRIDFATAVNGEAYLTFNFGGISTNGKTIKFNYWVNNKTGVASVLAQFYVEFYKSGSEVLSNRLEIGDTTGGKVEKLMNDDYDFIKFYFWGTHPDNSGNGHIVSHIINNIKVYFDNIAIVDMSTPKTSWTFDNALDVFYFNPVHGLSAGVDNGRLRLDNSTGNGEVHLFFHFNMFGGISTNGKTLSFDFSVEMKSGTEYLAKFEMYGVSGGETLLDSARLNVTGGNYNWNISLNSNYDDLKFYFWGTTDGGPFDINNCIVYIDNITIA